MVEKSSVKPKKPAAEKSASTDGLIEVKNVTSNNNISVTSGMIKAGETGKVTVAELSMLHEYFKKV